MIWMPQCTVMRFQQFQSTWNKNLSNLNSVQQNVAHMKADIQPKILTFSEQDEVNNLASGGF